MEFTTTPGLEGGIGAMVCFAIVAAVVELVVLIVFAIAAWRFSKATESISQTLAYHFARNEMNQTKPPNQGDPELVDWNRT